MWILIELGELLEFQPNRLWVITNGSIIGHCSTKGCSELVDQTNQAELQWSQSPSEINGDNLNNTRRKASRQCRNKKTEHLKNKMNLQHAVRPRTIGTNIEE
jgi:hypothetical protein